MRNVARPWNVKVKRSKAKGGQKQKQPAKKHQAPSAWTNQGGQSERQLVAKRAGENKNLESELARSNNLKSKLEAIKRALRESENRVQEFFLAGNEIGGGIPGATMSVELNTVSDASMSADNILDLNCSPEAKIGDFGNGHEDDVETPTEEAVNMEERDDMCGFHSMRA